MREILNIMVEITTNLMKNTKKWKQPVKTVLFICFIFPIKAR